jgi:hypothetical protein
MFVSTRLTSETSLRPRPWTAAAGLAAALALAPTLAPTLASTLASPALAQAPVRMPGPGNIRGDVRVNIRCPSPVTINTAMPPAAGWSGNSASWPMTLDPNPAIALQVVPLAGGGGATVICHYQTKIFDGTVIKGFAYSQTVSHATCAPNAAHDGFACTKP